MARKKSEAFKKGNLIILFGMLLLFVLCLIFYVFFNPLKGADVSREIKIKVVFNDSSIRAEVADDYASRVEGLSNRNLLNEDEGMIFIFEGEEEVSFWMYNMSFPIDILFLNSDREIVEIVKNAQPCFNPDNCERYGTGFNSEYVIEVVAGYADKHSIQVGDKVKIQEIAYVSRVIDGDTLIAGGESVRLICVDAPEKRERGFNEAREFLESLILGKEVVMERDISETDKYGRYLRYVYVDDLFVNREIVEKGYAKVMRVGEDISRCDDIEGNI
jgi:uncharacterized protein